MEHLSSHEVVTKIITYLTIVWGVIFIPSMVMVILVLSGHGTVASHSEASWRILYYNLLLFPVVMLGSSVCSWLLLKKKHYHAALIVALLPLLTILVELIAADIVLWFM